MKTLFATGLVVASALLLPAGPLPGAEAVEVAALTLDPTNVHPGGRSMMTVTLTEPVTAITYVDLGSSDASRGSAVNAWVSVSPGSRETTVLITTSATAAIGVVEISATRRGSTGKKTTLLTVRPPHVAQLIFGIPATVQRGDMHPGELVLEAPAGSTGLVVHMGSSDRSRLYIAPWNPSVAPGERTATFRVEARAQAAPGPVTVTAQSGGGAAEKSAVIEIILNQVKSVGGFSSPNAYAGESYKGRVDLELSAPTAGIGVVLSSSSPLIKVPASVYVPKGEMWASFAYTAEPPGPTEPTIVKITAVVPGAGGVPKDGRVTVRKR